MRLESAMWKRLRPALLAAKLDPVRVENPIHPGTPDVNLKTGVWIEMKALAQWPLREATIVAIKHFTPQQRVWLLQRWRAGGAKCFLLLLVQGEWLLFDGDVAAHVVGKAPASELRWAARKIAQDPAMLIEELR